MHENSLKKTGMNLNISVMSALYTSIWGVRTSSRIIWQWQRSTSSRYSRSIPTI